MSEPAVYNPCGYPVDEYVDGNLTVRDPTNTGKYGILTAAGFNGPVTTLNPSGDVTGAKDTTAINAALAIGDVFLAPGTYNIKEQTGGQPAISPALGNSLHGVGSGTVLAYSGASSCIYWHDSGNNGNNSALNRGGTLRDIVIDGTNAQAGAIGIDVGDGWGQRIDHVFIDNFAATGCIGIYLNNAIYYTEKLVVTQLHLRNNATAAVFDATNSANDVSHGYCNVEIFLRMHAGQNGVLLQNGANYYHGSLVIRGNAATSASSIASTYALSISGKNTTKSVASVISRCRLDVTVETDTNNADGPQFINFGTFAGNQIDRCYGVLSALFTWTASNPAIAGQVIFSGAIINDANLVAANTIYPASKSVVTDPTGTASTTQVMMGMGGVIAFTPQSSGIVEIIATGNASTATGAAAMTISGKYGTGTAPLNGAAASGNTFGRGSRIYGPGAAAGAAISLTVADVLTLTPGTTYWFDLSLATGAGADIASLTKMMFYLREVA